MQTLFVFLKAELGKGYDVADRAVELDEVSEVHSISGQYDLLLKCFLENGADPGHFVTSKVQPLPGVKETFTLIAFKAFS